MGLFVVMGPPAAGKSTYVKERAAGSDIVIDYDALATALSGPGSSGHQHSEHVRTVAFAARRAAIAKALDKSSETDVYVIHTNPDSSWMQRYSEFGAEVVTIDPGRDVVLARIEAERSPETVETAEQWYSRSDADKEFPARSRFTPRDVGQSDKSIRGDGAMPETENTTSASEGATAEPVVDAGDSAPDEGQDDPGDLGDAGKRALAANRKAAREAERRAAETQKQLDAALAQLKEFEDANKSEAERQSEAFEAAKAEAASEKARADGAVLELMRYQVGVEKGVKPGLIDRLQGATREEIEADADRLLADLADSDAPRKPKPDPYLGLPANGGNSTRDQFAAALHHLL